MGIAQADIAGLGIPGADEVQAKPPGSLPFLDRFVT
jgi:hypothetical protein